MKRKNYKKALDYLVLSETTYFPYTGCGEGFYANKMIIEQHFIKYYLSIGDTVSAIKRAMENLIIDVGSINSNNNALKLRQLLLKNHSEKELFDEVEKSISNIYFTNKELNKPFSALSFSVKYKS